MWGIRWALHKRPFQFDFHQGLLLGKILHQLFYNYYSRMDFLLFFFILRSPSCTSPSGATCSLNLCFTISRTFSFLFFSNFARHFFHHFFNFFYFHLDHHWSRLYLHLVLSSFECCSFFFFIHFFFSIIDFMMVVLLWLLLGKRNTFFFLSNFTIALRHT